MPKINPYYIPKLPDTATVAYYNPETDQNLTAEEWKQLNPEVNPSEVRIVNQGETYISWKAGVDYPAYGPMDFVDESTLMVARSQSITNQLRISYPTIVKLFENNPAGTIAFLKANEALVGYKITHDFKVPFSASGSGWKVWADYKNHIESYVEKLCRQLSDSKGRRFDEPLKKAREVLAKHVHDKYYQKFPRWPDVGKVNEGLIYLDVADHYDYSPFYLVWSCAGWVNVKDQRPSQDSYKAEFNGEPAIKLLVIDYYKLKELDGILGSKSFEDVQKMIDEKHRTRDRSLLTWETLK